MKARNSYWKSALASAVVLAVVLGSGCGDDNNGPTVDPYIELIDRAWFAFSEGDMTESDKRFGEAIATNKSLGDGYSGLGWVRYMNEMYPEALDLWDQAVARGFVEADAQAGRCLVLNSMNEFRQAANAGESALLIDSSFRLRGNESIEIRDVRLAVAQAYFALGEYELVLSQIESIDPAIVINRFSATFLQELLAALQNIEESISDR